MDTTLFGFMLGKETMDASFILRRLQEEYNEKDKNLYVCFVGLEKALTEYDKCSEVVFEKKTCTGDDDKSGDESV